MQDEKNSPSSQEMRQKIIEGLSSNLEILTRKCNAHVQELKGLDSDGLPEERGSPSMPNRLTGNWSDLGEKLELLLPQIPREALKDVFKPILKSLESLQKEQAKTSSKKQRYKDRLRKSIDENNTLKQRLGVMRRSLEAMEHELLNSQGFQKKNTEIEALKSKLQQTNQKLMIAKQKIRIASPPPVKNYSANASPVFIHGKLEEAQKEAEELAQKHDYVVHIAEVMHKQMALTNEKAKELAQLTQQLPEGTLKKRIGKVRDEVKIAISHFENGNFQKLILSAKNNDTHFSDLLLSKTQEIEQLKNELKIAKVQGNEQFNAKIQTRLLNNSKSKDELTQNSLDVFIKKIDGMNRDKIDIINKKGREFEEKLLGLEASLHQKMEYIRTKMMDKKQKIYILKANTKDLMNEMTMNTGKIKRLEDKHSTEITKKSHEINSLSKENKDLKISRQEFMNKLQEKEEEVIVSWEKIKNQSELIEDLKRKIAKSLNQAEELEQDLDKSNVKVQTLESKLKLIDQSSSDQLNYYKNACEKANEELAKEKDSLRRIQTELAKMQYEKTLHEEDRMREISVLSLKAKDFETSLTHKENELQFALEGFNNQKKIINELNKKVSDNIKMIENLREEKEENEQKAGNLVLLLANTEKNSQEVLNSYKEGLQNLKTELKETKTKCRNELNLEIQKNQELEKNKSILIKEKENLILNFDKNKDMLIDDIKKLEESIAEMENENTKTKEIIKQRNEEIDALKHESQEYMNNITKLQKELNKTEKAYMDNLKTIEVMETSVSDQVTYYKAEYEKLNKKMETIENEKNEQSLKNADLSTQIQKLLKEKTELDHEINKLNEEFEIERNKKSLKITKLEEQIAVTFEEKEELNHKLNLEEEDFHKRLEILTKNESAKMKDLHEQNQGILLEKNEIETKLRQEIEELNTQIQESETQIMNLQESTDKFASVVEKQDKELTSLNTELTETSEKWKNLKLVHDSLIKSSAEEIDQYKESIKSLQSKWNTLRDYCQSENLPIEEGPQSIIEILNSNATKLKSLEQDKSSLLSENSSLKASLEEKLNTEIEMLNSQSFNFQDSNTALLSELSSLRALCEKQEGEIRSLNSEKQELIDSAKDDKEHRKTPLHISMEREISIQSPSRALTLSTQPSLIISPHKTKQLESTHFAVSIEPSDPCELMIEKIKAAGELTVAHLELCNIMKSMIPKHSRKTSTMAQDQSLEEEINLISECLNKSLSQFHVGFDNSVGAEQASLSLDYANERLATENSSELPSKCRTESAQGQSEKQILDEQMIEYQRKEILALKEELKESSGFNVDHLKMMFIKLMQTIPMSRETDESLKPIIGVLNFTAEQLKLINSIRNPSKKGIWSKISNII